MARKASRATAEVERELLDRARVLREHPISATLHELLLVALEHETAADRRQRLELALVRVGAALRTGVQDATEAEARAVMVECGLLDATAEAYYAFVDGREAGVIVARNRWHAVNKAKRDLALDVCEYRYRDGRHELHGGRFAGVAAVDVDAIFQRAAGEPAPASTRRAA
jgi:hypothetical protein